MRGHTHTHTQETSRWVWQSSYIPEKENPKDKVANWTSQIGEHWRQMRDSYSISKEESNVKGDDLNFKSSQICKHTDIHTHACDPPHKCT